MRLCQRYDLLKYHLHVTEHNATDGLFATNWVILWRSFASPSDAMCEVL